MSPAFKYSYGRLGLFLLCFLVLLPTPLNILVKAMVALLVSAVLALFVLRKWRDQMGDQLSTASSRRSAEKARLRAALAGDEDAAAAGDRVVAASVARKSDEDEPEAAAVDTMKDGHTPAAVDTMKDGHTPAVAGEEKQVVP